MWNFLIRLEDYLVQFIPAFLAIAITSYLICIISRSAKRAAGYQQENAEDIPFLWFYLFLAGVFVLWYFLVYGHGFYLYR